LASWSDLRGVVIIEEPASRLVKRVRRELRRVGRWRLLDVLAMRIYYRLALAARDAEWRQATLRALCDRFPDHTAHERVIRVASPNSEAARQFIADARPDITLAFCKQILSEKVFSIATTGTFVLHPGICPEYRNSHGCFWALANDDLRRVGMTLLRIDRGIDTGPIYGHFTTEFNELEESHVVIQQRVVVDNLESVADRLRQVVAGEIDPILTAGRTSREWGQPWLSKYLYWKKQARRRSRARPDA
jgi:folate-dependent phosphoribosylglycinamide formyltransferase PurN